MREFIMSKLGILGTGRMGIRLAKMLAEVGQQVILGSRNIDRATKIVQGLGIPNLTAGNYEDAANADVIVFG
ncbi:NAD(P)-binding domain-containing protein [[Phormidium] sp. LEGE 05292]|uniref:NAD(P)-binding domain-containing protein n=1 Tax=[Phormidium] sp. LEGE 05292 TaxID=767427 RepID=UPI001D143ABF|nr:NAD(P)-binding domain-containing protein [Phormidium sp. LEGE 05292]